MRERNGVPRMNASPEKRPVVLVLETEAVSSALQTAIGADRAEVVLARHPAQARIAAGSRRPAVLLLPVHGGDAAQAKSLRGVLPSSARILGLVGEGDPLDPPEGVDRVAPLGSPVAIKVAVEALLEEAACATRRGGSLSSFVEELSLGEAAGVPGSKAAVVPEEEADVDPARAAAIRDLAHSMQMHRSMASGSRVSAPVQVVGISLSSVGRDDPSQVDIAVGSVSEALAALPEPSEAVGRTERLQALTAEREAAHQVAQEVARDREAQAEAFAQIRAHGVAREPTQAIELSFVKRRRRGRLVKLVVALVLCVGGGVGGFLYWQHRKEVKRRAYKPPPPEIFDETLVARAQAARKRGVAVDPFTGLMARTPIAVRATDVDFTDEQLHRSVPELDRWFEQALTRLSPLKVREQLLGRADPLVRFDDLKKAQGYLDRALKIRDGADVRELLATVDEKGGRPEQAQAQLLKALRFAPKRLDLRMRLGLILLKAGKRDEGCAELGRAAAKLKEARAAHRERCAGKGGAP